MGAEFFMPSFYKKTPAKRKPITSSRQFVVKTPSVATTHKPRLRKKVDTTVESLNALLEKEEQKKIKLEKAVPEENAVFTEDEEEIVAFDGVSSTEEAIDLYSQAASYQKKKARSVEEEVKQIEEEHEKEKKQLEEQIRELKRELHRTAPLHETKFFSLSKQLEEAIKEIDQVATISGVASLSISQAPSQPKEVPLPVETILTPPPVVAKPVEPKVVSAPQPEIKQGTAEEKKSLPKNKMLVTGASAVLALFIISGVFAKFITTKPKVDQELVAQYLSTAGQVQGAQSGAEASPIPQAEADPSQAEVNFEQSVWENFNDPNFGIALQFPKNAVKAIRTDSNVTFIRKTGYLFKIQRIETSLTLDEYWKQIKATSLNYVVSSEKFKGKPALKLELEDLTDYPGDRYLVKEGNFIYDVWYATPSNNFVADDIKRAEKMLDSLSITMKAE